MNNDTVMLKKLQEYLGGDVAVELCAEVLMLRQQYAYAFTDLDESALSEYGERIDRLLEQNANNPIMLTEKGRVCQAKQDYRNALYFYARSRTIWKNNPLIQFDEAFCFMQAGCLEEAKRKYQGLIEDYTAEDGFLGRAIECAYYMDNMPDTEKWGDEYTSLMQRSLDVRLQYSYCNLGRIYSLTGDYQQAIRTYKKINKHSRYYEDALYGIALSHFNLKNYPEARRVLKKIIIGSPNHWQAFELLGQVHEILKDPSSALHCYQRALAINIAAKDAIVGAAFILRCNGDNLSVVQMLHDKLSIFDKESEDFYSLSILLATCCIDLDNPADGLEVLENIPCGLREDSRYWVLRGLCLWSLNRHPESVHAFEKALFIDPTDVSAMKNLADGFMCSDDYERAVTYYKLLLENGDDAPIILGQLAVALAETGRCEEAMEVFKRLENSASTIPHQPYYKAWILGKSGKTEDAIAVLEDYVKIHDHENAIDYLNELYRKLEGKDTR